MSKPKTHRQASVTDPRPHALRFKVKGSGKRSGRYLCACGAVLSGINAFEKHRADERRRNATGA
jgi:hypothetical protein